MSKLITTTEPLTPLTNGRYDGVIDDVEDFIHRNKCVIGVKRETPFDGFKIPIVLYASSLDSTDIETINVNLIVSEEIDIDVIWDMMNDNIWSIFRAALVNFGYYGSLNPEVDKEKNRKMSIEKDIIQVHVIRRGDPMTPIYVKNMHYKYSLLSYYTIRNDIRIKFLSFCDKPLPSSEFNVIRVIMPIIGHLKKRDEVFNAISAQKSYFDSAVVAMVKSRVKFKNSGLTMNYFELTSCILTKDMRLIYTFAIKKSIIDAMKDKE